MAGKHNQDPEERYANVRSAAAGVLIPGMLFGCVIVSVVIGYFADEWLGSSPWGLLLGLVIGSVAGVREMMKLIRKMQGGKK